MRLIAIHEIEYREGGKKKVAAPGTVFTMTNAKTIAEVKAIGAARDLTDAEDALYDRQNPIADADADDEGDGEGQEKGDEAEAKAREAKGAPSRAKRAKADI